RHTRSDRDWSSDVCSADLPPNPNALTPARRGVPDFTVHGWSFVFTNRGECAKSMPGLWRWQLRLGGRTLSRSASVAFRSPAAPRSEEHTSELQSRSDLVCR